MVAHAVAQSLLWLSAEGLRHAGGAGLSRRDMAGSVELAAGAGRMAWRQRSLSGTGPVPPARATLATRRRRVHHRPVSQRLHAPVESFSQRRGSDLVLRTAQRTPLV